MDAFSDILRLIRLQSSVYFRTDFHAPWGMQASKGVYAQFHLIVRGTCLLGTPLLDSVETLTAGDIVVFPRGDEHWLADTLGRPMVAGAEVVSAVQSRQPVFDGDGAATTIVCGHFEFDRNVNHPFLLGLPPIILLRDDERRELSWLETATSVIIHEAGSGRAGADVVVDRLAEVLFIQVLRAYSLQQVGESGFMAALEDPQLSHALKLLHIEPQKSWTLESIARAIGMSRSSFAAKFREAVGLTPMDYLTSWRMLKARDLLRNRNLSLPEIAEEVGYTSEASFSRAFKRHFSQNPGAMRRSFV